MTDARSLFAGSGEMRALCREFDWAATSLGPCEHWSSTLRDIVRTVMASPFPIALWCGSDRLFVYNDAYIRVLGTKHPLALGRPGHVVWAEIWPQIEPMFAQIDAGGPPIYAEDSPFVVERSDQRGPAPADEAAAESGPNAWFTFALSGVRDDAGAIVAYLNIVSETTARLMAERATEAAREEAERAERRLRDVFAQAPAFMAVLRGEDHVFEYVNEAYYQLVGHRELLGRPVFDALPDVRGQGFEDLLDTVLESGEPFIGREVPVTVMRPGAAHGEQRFLDLVYFPIKDSDGTPSGVVAHGSDVTEHVLARAEAQRARAEAEQASQAKSQFLANMSHEIRTPINAVMGYTDLLDAGVHGQLNERQQSFVDRIRASSRHLLGLVDDVLDLAKVEAGEMSVDLEETAVEEVVRTALTMLEPQAADARITVEEAWECGPSAPVIGDANRVRQVVVNLLSNAIKFTAPGGRITVRCRMEELADPAAALPDVGPWIVIDVEDTGAGIPADQIERIFQPFVQADAGHTRRVGGTGLGLTISRRFARLMGGDLTVTSEVGKGSCFSLWLAPVTQERPLPATTEWQRAEQWPDAPQQIPGLGAMGQLLLATTDRVEQRFVQRLQSDSRLALTRGLDYAQLADHTAALLAVVAKTLSTLDDGGAERGLLEDSEALQAELARRHGRQRRRLGWSRAAIEREYRVLHDVLDRFLRAEARSHTTAQIDAALGVVHRLIDRAEQASLSEWARSNGDG